MFREYFSNGLKPPGMGASCAHPRRVSRNARYFVLFEDSGCRDGLKQKHQTQCAILKSGTQ